MKALLPLLLTALICLQGAGCRSYESSAGVEVSLANLRVTDATVLETTMEFTVRIDNAKPEPLVLQGGVHRLFVNGIRLGQGMTGESIEVPRFGSMTQAVSVHLSNLRMVSRIRSIMESRKIDYRLESSLYPAHGSRLGSVREGVLDLQAIPGSPAAH